ncbi:MAG: sulfatase-like hydrolase/transferase [Tannerella sp.]|jgi:choline-sulfatase|nr:sulfatase-like hydrolase/transferase [Tannerella sp.]
MRRVDLLKYAVLSPAILVGTACTGRQEVKRPNIIYIFTDQQSASMMSCAGNPWLKTPAMDYIAENGVRFTRAYAPNPVSAPARLCLITGRFPGYFRDTDGNPVRENGAAMRIQPLAEEVKHTTLASWMHRAGYELAYGGKQHLAPSLNPDTLGFNVISKDERDDLAKRTAEYIKSQHAKPYFLIVSLINPHDICYMAIRDFAQTESDKGIIAHGKKEVATLDEALKMPEHVSRKDFFTQYCPPLPPNFEPQEDEPQAVHWLINRRPFRRDARINYTKEDWRMHRWAYCRLTELVDKQIQIILNALKESGQEENTLVIFSSDHGDMDASHRLEHKTVLYEEAINIPFLVMWKGTIPASVVDSVHLISNGLDLLPTVSDYAGFQGKADERGRSIRPLLECQPVEWRKSLGIESQIGRAVIDAEHYKYVKYDVVDEEEQLLDHNKDPYETRHFTSVPEYAAKLVALREQYDEWFPSPQ